LHTVTDDFIAHLAALGDDADLNETTEFLVVAATLLDLKAARLLPNAEVEDGEDLALLEARDLLFARLLQCRAYKQGAQLFAELAASVFRPKPPPTVSTDHLHAVHVSVAEHAEILRERLAELGSATFAELTADCTTPLEIVARFLAVLDLYRSAVVDL